MNAYPACDWCGLCEHCPAHGGDCEHPCAVCGTTVLYDSPGCPNEDCPSWDIQWGYDDWELLEDES